MLYRWRMVDRNEHRISSKLRRLTGWAGFGLVMLGILSGVSTFAILTGLTPITPGMEDMLRQIRTWTRLARQIFEPIRALSTPAGLDAERR